MCLEVGIYLLVDDEKKGWIYYREVCFLWWKWIIVLILDESGLIYGR